MFKKIRRFFKEYKQLGFVIIAFIVGIVLDLSGQDTASHWVLGVSAIANALPLAWGMLEDFRSGKYGLDILALTAIVTSVLLKEFWAGMVIVLMLTGGEALEDYAEKRAKSELSDLLRRRPKKAHLIRGTQVVDVSVKEIKPGDRLEILPGEVIPVDGVIIEGSSSFDESSLTGESLPVLKNESDQVLSGSINVEGAIKIRALQSAADSQYEQIIKLVKSAAASQAPFVRLADRYSIPFTVVAFIIAGAAWIVSGDPVRFLEVIVVATPCPLILGAPIALISGMSRAAKQGIIVKTGSALERLAEIQTMAFDKTGTLTRGTPQVDTVKAMAGFDKKEVLQYAAALEMSSTHVLAQAIVEAASKQAKIHAAKQIKEMSGQGLQGRLNGKTVHVGRLTYLQAEEVEIPKKDVSAGQTATYVAINGKLAGVISFVDEIRPETKTMLGMLKKYKVRHTLMVTGDNQVTAEKVAKTLGIENVVAECLPGDKIRAIEALEHRPVGFVGDGVNDAPVLTAADVGIALGARGSTAASESADVVIMLDDITKVAASVSIAKRTFFIAKQSILMGIFISLGLMAVFSTGKFSAVQGAAVQELVDVAVILNALRAHGSFRRGR